MAKNQYQDSIEEAFSVLEKMEAKWKSIDAAILSASKNAKNTGGQDFNSSQPKDLSERLKKNATYQKQVNAELKESERLQKALDTATAKYNQATSKTNKELQKKRFETNQLNKEERQNAVLTSKLASEYQKQSVRLNQLRDRYKELATRQKIHNDLSRGEVKEMRDVERQAQKLDTALKDVDSNVGQNFRSVGNYQNALKGASIGIKNFAGALGLTSGVYLFASALKAGFDAVTEFDSGLKNVQKTTGLAEIDIESLGGEVIKLSKRLEVVDTSKLLEYATVAGQLGVKGSANILAFTETLAKLETASDIAGEEGGANIARLLTLVDGGVENVAAFGDEIVMLGNNFAATENEILGNATAIAQNTGIYKLGRQQVLAYATATKALGIDQEITGSTIGRTLGIVEKAIRTGKGIAEITKLTGKSVDELKQQFNEDAGSVFQDLVKGLNGVDESGGSVNEQLEKLGIIAVRDQRVIGSLASAGYETLAKAMDDVGIASNSLNNEFGTASQKIVNRVEALNVAFNNLILNIENGSGPISSFFLKIIDGATDALNILGKLNMTEAETNEAATEKEYQLKKKRLEEYGDGMKEEARIQYQNSQQNIINLQNERKELEKRTKEIEESTGVITQFTAGFNKSLGLNIFNTKDQKEAENAKKRIEEINKTLPVLKGAAKAAGEQLGFYSKKTEEVTVTTKENTTVVNENTAAKKEINKIAKGSITFYEQQIASLEQERDAMALNKDEYELYTEQIYKAKDALAAIKEQFKEVGGDEYQFNIDDLVIPEVDNEDDIIKVLENDLKDYKEFQDRKTEILKDASELRKDLESDFLYSSLDAVSSIASSIFDAETAKYDDILEKNNEFYDELLSREDLNDKQRQAIEEERVQKEKEIQKKKEDAQLKALLFQKALALVEIGINLAKTIAAINLAAAAIDTITFGIGGAAYRAANIPLAIGTASAQVAAVAASAIPALKDGDLSGNREGVVKINDAPGNRFKEIVQRNNGKLEYAEGRNVLTNLNKGDKVYKAGTAPNGMDYNDLMNATINMSLADQHGKMNVAQSQAALDRALVDEIKKSNSATQASNAKLLRAIRNNKPIIPDMGKSMAAAILLDKRINK